MTRSKIIAAAILIACTAAMAQTTPNGTDPVFWCDISRSQVSHERDAGLAQIEALKYRIASLETHIKELEAKAKEPKP